MIDDLESESRFQQGLTWLRRYELRSYCVLPLTAPQGRLGALGFGSKRPNAFASHDFQFLNRVAEMVALSVDNTLRQAALAEERERAHILLEIESTLAASMDLQELLAAVARSARRLIPQDSASIVYFDESAGAFRQFSLDPPLPGQTQNEGALISLDDSVAGQAFRQEQLR